MFELLADPNFIRLLTLADASFYLAIAAAIGLLYMQSVLYCPDKYFRKVHFHIGCTFSTVLFLLDIWLSEQASVGSYRPILIAPDLYEMIHGLVERKVIGNLKAIDIEAKILGEILRWLWPAIMAGVVTFILFLISTRYPPPEWHKGMGIQVVFTKTPNIVDYSIFSIALRCLAFTMLLGTVTVILFDLMQFALLWKSVTKGSDIPAFFADQHFDYRFFIALPVTPFLLAVSIGTVFRIRHMMLKGPLYRYRPEELRASVDRQKFYYRHVQPDIGTSSNTVNYASSPNRNRKMPDPAEPVIRPAQPEVEAAGPPPSAGA